MTRMLSGLLSPFHPTADLRQMRFDNNNRDNFTPRDYGGGITVGHAGNTTRTAPSYRDDLIGPPPAQTTADGETTFARGGHGIFGMPKVNFQEKDSELCHLTMTF